MNHTMRAPNPNALRRLLHRCAPAFIMLFACVPPGAFAASLQFVPMSILLDSEQKRGTLRIMNRGEEKVTVQLQMMKWEQDSLGEDVYEPTKDLVFYPQIVTIGAGKEGVIRVGYERTGPALEEKSYRLFVQELPVSEPGKNVIKIALKVGIPVFLASKNPRPLLSYEDARIENGRLQVRIKNSGNTHAIVQKINVTGLDEDGAIVFSKESSGWYVLPGISRAFSFDVAPEECRKASIMQIAGTAGDQPLRGQFNVDKASCAQLEESGGKGKLDMDKLPPPTAP